MTYIYLQTSKITFKNNVSILGTIVYLIFNLCANVCTEVSWNILAHFLIVMYLLFNVTRVATQLHVTCLKVPSEST